MMSPSPVPITLKINRPAAPPSGVVRPVMVSSYAGDGSSPEARRADQMVAACRENVRFLNHHLRQFGSHLSLPLLVDNVLYLAYTVTVRPEAPFSADCLRRHLANAGVETKTAFTFTAGLEDMLGRLGISAGDSVSRSFCLGCHRDVSILDLDHIIAAFESFFARI